MANYGSAICLGRRLSVTTHLLQCPSNSASAAHETWETKIIQIKMPIQLYHLSSVKMPGKNGKVHLGSGFTCLVETETEIYGGSIPFSGDCQRKRAADVCVMIVSRGYRRDSGPVLITGISVQA